MPGSWTRAVPVTFSSGVHSVKLSGQVTSAFPLIDLFISFSFHYSCSLLKECCHGISIRLWMAHLLHFKCCCRPQCVDNCDIYFVLILCTDIHRVDIGRHQPLSDPADLHLGVYSAVQGPEDWRTSTTYLCRWRQFISQHEEIRRGPVYHYKVLW